MRKPRSKPRTKRRRTREAARAAALKRTKKRFRQLLNSREFDFYLTSEASAVATLIASVWGPLESFLSIPPREVVRYKGHLQAILLNLYAAHVADPNRYVALGLGKASYSKRGRYSSSWASHGITTKVLSALRSKRIALIDMHAGMYDRAKKKGYRTRIRATPALVQKFENSQLRPDMISKASDHETVRLKDSEKTLIEYLDDANTNRMRSNLALINTSIAESYIGLHVSDELRKGLDVADRQLYRVFNDGLFERGGRFFGGWWQSIPGALRRHIYVAHKNGEYPKPTRELDYSSMQPNLAYAMCGHEPPKDAYRIDVPGEWNDRLPICKARVTLWIGKDPRRRAAYKWEPAMKNVRFVGLDVHAETIAVAVAEVGGEVRSLGVIPNRAESVGRLIRKLGKPEQLRVCYEAGPTGYVLYWQLSELGVKCEVVAPTLVPVKAGDRVKTDRRDAEKLARSYRAGDQTAVWVPDAAHEALREVLALDPRISE
jgi:hypothetical protein